MKIEYCRVSTDDQHPDLQLAALKRAGCKRIFTDKASGAHVTRPELTKCLKALNAGDVLIVWKLDRLARSLRDLIGLLDDLFALPMSLGTMSNLEVATTQAVAAPVEEARTYVQEQASAHLDETGWREGHVI